MSAKYKPDDMHTLTPFFELREADSFLQFIQQVFGARAGEIMRMPDGTIAHVECEIGDSKLMLSDHPTNMPLTLYVYVEAVDQTYRKALSAGATSQEAPTDQFWGDRQCTVKDRWGNTWWIATQVEEVSPQEMEKRMAAMAGGPS